MINLRKASTSLAQQIKPIHEIECEDGTITQDPEIMKEEGHRFASDRFQDSNNDQDRAAAKTGKGADLTNTVAAIIKHLPYKSTTHIHNNFNNIYNSTKTTSKPHKPNNNNEQPTRWQNTDYNGLQKHSSARLFKDHRWIAKLDHYRQWFNKGWLPLYDTPYTTPHNPRSYGLMKGYCPQDVTGVIREIFMKGHRWNYFDALMFSGDIEYAFDSTKHDLINDANKANNKPPKTRLATLKDYHDKTGTITINNTHVTKTFKITRGGMQGGTRTPKEFNNCINFALKPVITKWYLTDIGFKLEGKQINNLIWADNIFLFARNPTELQIMIDDITEALGRVGLRWKPDSPVILATRNFDEYNTQLYTDIHNTPQFIPLATQTNVLGEMMDNRGNTNIAQLHR